jgi:hypothetical protein
VTDKSPSILERVDNFVRGVANGATFGLADYIAGAANTVVSGGTLSGNISKELDRTANTGVEGMAGQVTGSLMDGIGAANLMLGGVRSFAGNYAKLKIEAAAYPLTPGAVNAVHKIGHMLDDVRIALAVSIPVTLGSAASSLVTNIAGQSVFPPPPKPGQ